MFDLRLAFSVVVRSVSVAALLVGVSAAQITHTQATASIQQDVFASVHQVLNDAADRTLAASLSQRSWMQRPAESPVATNPSSVTVMDPAIRVRAAIKRVDQLRPTIEPILREEGVPAELSAIVLVESGGSAAALSPKGARGVWQFMPDTARRYGLVVSSSTDQRLDIVKSTRAAARYLSDLHNQFGDWQLALAAYNAGEHVVGKALGRTGQRSFSIIATALPRETRDYVPAVLQAISFFGGNLSNSQPLPHLQSKGRVLYAFTSTNN